MVPPQRAFAEHAVIRIEIFLPQRRRLDNVRIAVEYGKLCHLVLPYQRVTEASAASAAFTSSSVGHQFGR